MKIMLLCDSMGIGGAETHVLGLAKGLCAEGHTVTVVAKRGELAERLLRECKGRGQFVGLFLRGRGAFEMAAYAVALGELIKKEKPTVVHAHSRVSAFAVHLLRCFGVVPRFAFAVTAHAKYRTSTSLKLLSVWGDVCIAVSDDIKKHLVERYGLDGESITVIPNGIDTDEFCPKNTTNAHSILFASRLDEDSSLGAFCLCMIADKLSKKYPDLKITIAGGGSELEKIREAANGNVKIDLLGSIPSLSSAISEASVVVGVSRVALEGMACGKNVILFGNEGALGILDEDNLQNAENTNFTCRGFGVKSEAFLFDEIDRLFSMSDAKRGQMAANNRAFITEKHSQSEVVNETLRVYRRLLGQSVKIAVGGYYGFGNIGDEALLNTLLEALRDVAPDACVSVLNKTAKSADGVSYVCRYSPLGVVRTLSKADAFVLGGGSLLQNDTSLRSLIYYCSLISLSKMLGCKCVLLSNGIGPINGRLAERLTKVALSKADHVSLRDEESLRLARRLGKRDARISTDLCFGMNMEIKSRVSSTTERLKALAPNGYAVIALKGGNEAGNKRLLFEVRELCRRCGWLPVFVAMDQSADAPSARKAANLCKGIFVENMELEDLFALLSRAETAIGERLHFLIFSLALGVGFVGVGNAPKIKSFVCETVGMDTVGKSAPKKLKSLVFQAREIPREALLAIGQMNKKLAEGELRELKKLIFIK